MINSVEGMRTVSKKLYIHYIIALLSLFYCVPLPGLSSFRIYDLVYLSFFLIHYKELILIWKLSDLKRQKVVRLAKYLWWIMLFSLCFSIILFGIQSLEIKLVRIVRFSFFLWLGIFSIVINNSKTKILKSVFYFSIAILIVSLISVGQMIGAIPALFPRHWIISYGGGVNHFLPTSSLSPHHFHIGIVMIIGASFSVYFMLKGNVITKFVAGLLFLLSFLIPSIVHTLTGILGVAIVSLLTLFTLEFKKSIGFIVAILIFCTYCLLCVSRISY